MSRDLAVIFDVAGTMLRMYRVAKDIPRGRLMEKVITSELIMEKRDRALLIPSFSPDEVISSAPDTLISHLFKEMVEISCCSTPVSKEEALAVLRNSRARTAEIQETHKAVRARCPPMYQTAGVIVDTELGEVSYAISTGGVPFPGLRTVLEDLEDLGADVYVASGDSMRSLLHLADHGISLGNIYAATTPRRKQEIVLGLRERYCRVVMVGDGLNDLYAIGSADLGVLTVQQNSRPPPCLFQAADSVIKDLLELPNLLREGGRSKSSF
jgi:Cu+-exporting ATPase